MSKDIFHLNHASSFDSKNDRCTYLKRPSGVFFPMPESKDTIVIRGFNKALCTSRAPVIIFEGQLSVSQG